MSEMMTYRVDSYNIVNGNFSTYREEKRDSQKPRSAGKTTKKKAASSKTPTINRSRKITQKENREVNTTDKGSKRKNTVKIHLPQCQLSNFRNLENCDMSQINPWQANNLAQSFVHSNHSYLHGGFQTVKQPPSQSEFHTTIVNEP